LKATVFVLNVSKFLQAALASDLHLAEGQFLIEELAQKHIFSLENVDSLLLRNIGNYQQVHTASQSRQTTKKFSLLFSRPTAGVREDRCHNVH
jgi:hypothetical protein